MTCLCMWHAPGPSPFWTGEVQVCMHRNNFKSCMPPTQTNQNTGEAALLRHHTQLTWHAYASGTPLAPPLFEQERFKCTCIGTILRVACPQPNKPKYRWGCTTETSHTAHMTCLCMWHAPGPSSFWTGEVQVCILGNNFKSCMPPTKQTKIQVRLHYWDITHSPHDMLVHVTRPWPLPFLNRRGSSVHT